MQTEITQSLLDKIPMLSSEKQRDLLVQVESLLKVEEAEQPTIWQKIRARAKNIPDEVWGEMPRDGSENQDHYLYGAAKK